jgi:hypothetical protein
MGCATYELTDRNLAPLLADLMLEEMPLCEVSDPPDTHSGRNRSLGGETRDLLTAELL